jgi:RNA polymerase sigma factor (sigma-70 family)
MASSEGEATPRAGGSCSGRDALRRLAETHARALFAYCYRRLGDRHLAEDAVQEAFYRATRRTARDEVANMPGWLFGAARRCCAELSRRRRRRLGRRRPLDDAAGEPDVPAAAPDDLSDRLELALGRLSDGERGLIYMKHTQGMRCREIAEATGRPIGTVTAALARAYAKLREDMQADRA